MYWEHPQGVPIVWSPYRITPIYWLMARMPSSTFLCRHPYTGELAICSSDFSAFLWFLCLHKVAISALLFHFFWPDVHIVFFAELLHLHFGNCNCGTMSSSRWSAWIFSGNFLEQGSSWGSLRGKRLPLSDSSLWNGHCKRCRPPGFRLGVFEASVCQSSVGAVMWVVDPSEPTYMMSSVWSVVGLLSI